MRLLALPISAFLAGAASAALPLGYFFNWPPVVSKEQDIQIAMLLAPVWAILSVTSLARNG